MRAEFIGVWSETFREIWQPLIDDEDVPADIFCELYRVLAGDPKRPGALKITPTIEGLADIVDDPLQAREAFERTTAQDLVGERELVSFLELVHDALEELGSDQLTNRYFNFLAAFIDKFSLRYDLRRPCILCPTVPGLFASLYRRLSRLAVIDSNVAKRLRDASEAVQDLRLGQTEGRVANCVTKQVMLLEAVAAAGGVSGTDLSAICRAVSDWPHPAIRASLLNAYGFASDFPGIRHGTPTAGLTRDVDMRDMIAMSILFVAFAPYLNRDFNGDALYLSA
jgi:hypothetical protein